MVALDHPGRVCALTLMAAEPLGWDGDPLPHIAPALLDHFGTLAALDTSDAAAIAGFLLTLDRLCQAGGAAFDDAEAQARIAAILARSDSPGSAFNHAGLALRRDWAGAFRRIAAPVLVIHGERDPVLPLANGRALADGIPGARLLVLEDTGHALRPHDWPRIARAIAGHPADGA